jgi:hypothetical protein
MSDWDYGLGEQIAEEYEEAIKNGLCRLCLIRKVEHNGSLCSKCLDEIVNHHEDFNCDD